MLIQELASEPGLEPRGPAAVCCFTILFLVMFSQSRLQGVWGYGECGGVDSCTRRKRPPLGEEAGQLRRENPRQRVRCYISFMHAFSYSFIDLLTPCVFTRPSILQRLGQDSGIHRNKEDKPEDTF